MNYTFALAGNPNCGKTTLFNALTGSNQRVGNWPGVTVEKKVGKIKVGSDTIDLVDLPGIYSLSPYSIEEKVSRGYIVDENPDLVINIVDATNMERNLYLTTQIMELRKPVVVALNMMDEVTKNGDRIDIKSLEKSLGTPVIPISAKNKTGLNELMAAAVKLAKEKKLPSSEIYDEKINDAIKQTCLLIPKEKTDNQLWYAIKLLESDAIVFSENWVTDSIKTKTNEIGKVIGEDSEDREDKFAEQRYTFISKAAGKSLVKNEKAEDLTFSDKIDKIVTNRVLAIPIFAGIMYLLFQLSFGGLSSFLADTFEGFFGMLGEAAGTWLEGAGASEFVRGLVVDGVIGGVGGIAPFIPPIALMFVFMTILEDSGYLARAAFIMDKIFRKFGLSGKSFIPMLIGFGCTAPAVMAARTLENEKDRKLTIMLTPFMSCGARLPIYGLFASAFFPGNEGKVVFAMYFLGIAVAIVSGIFLKSTLFKGEISPFIMELPPYRLPAFRDLCLHVWEKIKGFIIRAGTVIVAVSVIIWLTSTYTFALTPAEDPQTSILAIIGGVIAPLFIPCGFGFWQASAALITGFAAKEAVVSTMAVLFGTGEEALGAALQGLFTPLTAVSFMVFCLLYVPCGAAFMTVRREMGTWKWTWIAAGYQIAVAWVLSAAVFLIGSAIGF